MSAPENGRVGKPTGLSSSTEPHSRLGPTGFDPSRVGACPTCGHPTHRLCYVEGPWAYFTSLPLEKQWGDDWDDAPYEHNAGTPYEDTPGQIVRLAWEGPLDTPDAGQMNSPWSVQDINRGHTAWLGTSRHAGRAEVRIYADVSVEMFRKLVTEAGGRVYFPCDSDGSPKGGDGEAGSVRSTTARAEGIAQGDTP